MNIFEADKSDAEELVDKLWLPMAKEMEELSDFNSLSGSDVRANAVKYFTDRLRKDKHVFLVAEIDGDFAGFVSMEEKMARPVFERDKYGHIHELFVRNKYRREGVASKLLDHLEEYSREKDLDMLSLSVNVRNRSAIQLYEEKDYRKERTMMIKNLD